MANELDSTLKKCISGVFDGDSDESWGRGIVKVEFGINGKLTYNADLSEPSSQKIEKAVECAKSAQRTEHTLNIESKGDVYIVHRWFFTPAREPPKIWSATGKTPKPKNWSATGKAPKPKKKPASKTAKGEPDGMRIRAYETQAKASRVQTDYDISYSSEPPPEARRVADAQVRKIGRRVAQKLLERGKPAVFTFKIMFAADENGLTLDPILVSSNTRDKKKVIPCLRCDVEKIYIAKGAFDESTVVRAEVRVMFE